MVVHDILQDCSAFIFRVKQMKNRTTGNKTGSHIGIAVDTGWLETVASQSLDVVGETHISPPKWLFVLQEPEDEDSTILQNITNYRGNDMASHP